MEVKNINELKANPNNPRTISKDDFNSLKKSIQAFGDLSGIIFNITTRQLVGGHQRVEAFKALGGEPNIIIEQRSETPTDKGTMAYGYVVLDGEHYSYREVQWSLERELAANIAANRISGEFDNDLLAEVTYQIQQEDPLLLELTGQTQKEIDKLLQQTGVVDNSIDQSQKNDDEKETLAFRLTSEQKQLILQAIEHIRITKDIPSQDPKSMNGSSLYYMAQQYLSSIDFTTNPQNDFIPSELPE